MISKQKPVVVVGSINVDFVVTVPRIPVGGETLTGSDFQTHFGGKGANQAVAVARLGYPVQMIGVVGSDAFGAQVRQSLHDNGVGVDAVGFVEGSSGVTTITVSASGENAIAVVPGANAQLSPEYLNAYEDLIRRAGIVLAQLEIPMETVAHLADLCRRHHVPLVLDPAPARELPPDIFRKIDWFTPNQTESAFYIAADQSECGASNDEQMAAGILAKGCRGVVLKLGSQGACVATAGGQVKRVAAFKVDAVDTTAAGDAFNGGFATGLMLGKSIEESAVFAAAVAAISVTRSGAQESMPSMIEVAQLMEGASLQRG